MGKTMKKRQTRFRAYDKIPAKKFCALAAAFAAALAAAAQTNAPNTEPAFELDEIVVTGTPAAQRLGNVTSAVSVFDDDAIGNSDADYIMDVISSLPGVYVRRDGIYGRQDISIRGMGSNLRRIQVLIDGRPEKMSLFGCTVAQTLPLANVERIEALRGPEAVLYGTDAMGGVINIITRRRRDPGFETGGMFSYGSYQTLHGLLRHGGKTASGFDYYAVYDRKQTDGHRPNSEYEADFGALRLGQNLGDAWRLEASGQYFRDKGHDPGPVNNPYVNDDLREYRRWSGDASLSGTFDRSRLQMSFFNNAGEHEFNMPTINDFWRSKDRTVGASARYSYDLLDDDDMKDTPTVGYEYQYWWAEPQESWIAWARQNMPARFMNFDDQTTHNHDVFAFNELTVGRWINTLGARLHYDDRDHDWVALPHAGLLCRASETTTVRAKAARGFRQPRFSELYLFPAHNERLKPEDTWGYDLGVTQTLGSSLSVNATPFLIRVNNAIQTVPNDSPPPASINRNSGAFYIKGVESGLTATPLPQLRLAASYTYMDIDDADSGDPNSNREGMPEHAINASLELTLGKTRLAIETDYIAGLYDSDLLGGGAIQRVDNYSVTGARAAYQAHENIEVFGGVRNLFDENYEQIPGYPMPGITVYAGLRAEI